MVYVAGMMCFACRPDWADFAVLGGGPVESVIRLRIIREFCWALGQECRSFGETAAALAWAIRDSAVARRAPRSTENLDMVMSQQALCDWMHEQVASHPFKLPSAEDNQLEHWVPLAQAESSARAAEVDALQVSG